jgi:hypothetical protein
MKRKKKNNEEDVDANTQKWKNKKQTCKKIYEKRKRGETQ